MKIFVGHSFKKEDREVVNKILDFIRSYGFECLTGERSEDMSVSQKVKTRIEKCDLFIAIFTREKKISKFFRQPQYSTSSWVIQESGYAIAKCTHTIFLFEEQVDTRLGLQSDLEYITFDRNKSLENTFKKLSEMINCIACDGTEADTDIPKQENNSGRTVRKEIRNEICKGSDIQKIDLKMKLNCSDEYDIVKKSYEELDNLIKDEEEKLKNEALFLYRSELFGVTGSIEKLIALSEKHPENCYIRIKIAEYYEKLGAYDKAKNIYAGLSDFYKTQNDEESYSNCLYFQSKCILPVEGYEAALLMLNNRLYECKHPIMYKNISLLAHDNKDWDTFFNYAEYYLKLKPDDNDLRFKLAYAYSDYNDRKKLSFYHYKILNNTSNSGMYYNNIGVLYDDFKLNIKSVNSYKKAITFNETLSVANLAQLYINNGFLDEAKQLLSGTEKLKNDGVRIHPNVGRVESSLASAEKKENEKEEKIFYDAQKYNQFIVKYAKEYCTLFDADITKLSGVWATHLGEYNLEFDKKFQIEFKSDAKSNHPHMRIGLKGQIVNRALNCLIVSVKDDDFCRVPGLKRGLFNFGLLSPKGCNAYGIISEDYRQIQICVLEDDEIHYYVWKKMN